MANLDIRINIKELSKYGMTISNISDRKSLLPIIGSFSQYIRSLYIAMIKEAINSRRYKGKWEPVEEKGYLEYLGITPESDILDLIRESLESRKIGYNFIIRVNPDYRYPGTDIPLSRVLRAIESGTSKFNARPILSKISRKINSSMKELWKSYLAMKGVI